MLRRFWLVLFIFSLCLSSLNYSQQWTIFNTSNSGLPSNNIFDIEFTGDSAIWFATDSGLAFYDWNEWTVYDSTNSGLLTNHITAVSFSEDGTMWVGCTSSDPFSDSTGGLVRLKDSVWTAYTLDNSDLNYPYITEIETIGSDKVWVWSYWPAIPEQFGLLQIFDGINWITATDTNGIYRVYTIDDFCTNDSVGYAVMGYDGLAVLVDSTWEIYNTTNSNLPGTPVTSVIPDDSGNIWFSIYTFSLSPLNKFDGFEFFNIPVPFSYGQVGTVDIDSEGAFWFGTYFDGLVKLDSNQVTEYKTSNSPLASNNVRVYRIDSENRIWLWNEQQLGIVVFDPDAITSVNDQFSEGMVPDEFKLYQNYPNPFNPTTKISWQSPVSSHKSIKIYDILGNQVATLVDEYKNAGSYEIEFDGTGFSSGIYFVRLTSGTQTEIIKINLLK